MPIACVPHRSRARRAVAALASAGLLVVGLGACSDDGEDAAPPTTVAPAPDGEVVGSGERYEATIRRATDGVPHVSGDTIADAAFGQGYASGEDHTCDLADQVLKIRGERARWLGAGDGDAHRSSDIAWRGIGIHARASADWDEVPEENRELFEAFTAGWNTHLDHVGVDGVGGWCQGEPWVQPLEPVDVYAYARSVILLASSAQLTGYLPSAAPPAVAAEPDPDPEAAPGDGDPAEAVPANVTSPVGTGPDLGRFAESLSVLPDPAEIGSNGWAIGSERSEGGGGMLVANPHFPWYGELRFWEVHLTVPGEVDIYGAQLTGLPGVGIGFTDDFGWTHTVSAGNRFTAYRLALQPGSPTTYRYGEEWRDLTPTEHTIEVLQSDGTVATTTATTWASHYGPVIDFPGFGWTADAVISVRDANIDNDEFIDQYFGMLRAQSFDEFVEVHAEHNGVPLFNTVATSADGRAWYADTSATPNLSPEALTAYEASLETDPIAKVAADSGAILLDGSDPTFEWVDAPGARDPGLVPAADQPRVERDDYVFNANDSFWMPHATALLEGDYSPLHGRQGTVRSLRTRENATVLDDTTATGPAGSDGMFSLDELADAALANQGFAARALLTDVVERCQAAPGPVAVPATEADGEVPGLPAGTVDLGAACTVLADWDGVYDLDRAGPPLWREFLLAFDGDDVVDRGSGTLWSVPFDAAHPLTTPSGLAGAPGEGPDPVLVNLARAVQALEAAGLAPDATLGSVQFALRNGTRIPVHGGTGIDGTTNIVGYGGLSATITDPSLTQPDRQRLAPGSALYRLGDEVGTPIVSGTSFLMALEFTDDGPQARAFLVYGQSEDPTAEIFTAATQRFSAKDWRPVEFTEDDVAAATTATVTVRG